METFYFQVLWDNLHIWDRWDCRKLDGAFLHYKRIFGSFLDTKKMWRKRFFFTDDG